METNIINLSVSKINDELYPAGRIKFDNAVQRTYVWDNDRQSLLIHSLITQYPVPPIYVNQYVEDSKSTYDVLDGKQRIQTIIKFLNDEIRLGELEPVQIYDKTSQKNVDVDISNLTFSELDKAIQKKIENAQLMCISVVANEDEIAEMFFRLNNGKALSSIEHIRAKSKDLTTIQELGNHKLFTTSLTKKAFEKYTHEETVIKAYVVLYDKDKDLSAKSIKNKMPNIKFTDEQKGDLKWCFDYIYSMYEYIINCNRINNKLNKRIAKRIITRTHMLSLLPLIMECKEKDINYEIVAKFCMEFFSGSSKATNDEDYNASASAGSSATTNVNKRIERILYSFEEFNQTID